MPLSRLLLINAAEGLLQLLFASRPVDRAKVQGQKCAGREEAPLWTFEYFEEVPAASQGAEVLAPRIRAGLGALGLRPGDLTHVAAVRGPGSFTGLRLALATTSGLARAVGALRAGLDYLPLLALSARMRLDTGPAAADFWVLTHARRALVHAQGFICSGPADARISGLQSGSPPDAASVPGSFHGPFAGASLYSFPVPAFGPALALSPEEALGLIAAHAGQGRRSVLLGSGLERNREAFERGAASLAAKFPSAPLLLGPEYDSPTPDALLAAASAAAFGASDPEPLYVRPSDAEENLEAIAASLKLDPAAARRRLEQLTGRLTE